MKTQLITLESHDDLISVRDRMSWAKTPRILLVAPKFEKITLRQVDLKVLQRHATALGAQLGMVTRTRRLRAEAQALGIPVFESTGQAQRVAWQSTPGVVLPRKTPDRFLREKREQVREQEGAWQSSPVIRILAFSLGLSAVLVIAGLFIPRAQVTVTPISKTQNVKIPVMAGASVDSVSITGSIPWREKRMIVEGTQTVTVTGQTVVPQSKAQGIVEFRNLTQEAVTLPAGTVVRAGDVRFATTEEASLAAGVGKTVEVPVEALVAGMAGNLPVNSINAVESRLGLSVSVTNLEPTTGGRELGSLQASDADRARAKELLMTRLEGEVRDLMASEMLPDDLIFDETFDVSQILVEEYDPPSGAAGATVTLTMKVEYSVRYASASDMTELATLSLNASLPTGFLPASDEVAFTLLSTPVVLAEASADWSMRAERTILQQVDTRRVLQLIYGLNVHEASERLKVSLPPENSPEIVMFPSWWRWIPLVPFRIEVVPG